MIVYVESNFILEIALLQEEVHDAYTLLELARQGRIELRIPSFAFAEPFTTLSRRQSERHNLARSIHDQLRQLRRSSAHTADYRRLRFTPRILEQIAQSQNDALDECIRELLRLVRRIELTDVVFEAAINFRDNLGFSTTQDAIIMASVVIDLQALSSQSKRVLVTRNAKDFEQNPLVRQLLEPFGCVIRTRFSAAAGYIQAELMRDLRT